MWADEPYKENNQNGCNLKNIGQSNLIFGKPISVAQVQV